MAYLCREKTLKNALFDKRNFEYEQPPTDKRLQMQTAKRSETPYTEQIGPWDPKYPKNMRKSDFLANFSHFWGI